MLWYQPSATDLRFITLRKSEALFSPSTRIRDLALGSSLFHDRLRRALQMHANPAIPPPGSGLRPQLIGFCSTGRCRGVATFEATRANG